MSTALYRRYRPETFADVIGQEHVTEPLMTALRKNRVNHAYLFSGPRGCGKTTSARILARCLNCAQGPTDTPCGVCDSCVELARDGSGSLDVIEIDAASHGGVDDARDLRERATFAPVRDRYKVFIIDEAHMVTSAGFNALLKIVEEPPEHILFIFATTEPDKVIGTIRSRTHHYPFRLVPPEPLLAYLERLCAEENVPVAPGVLSLVIRAGGGSVRDTLSVLDQLMAGAGDEGLSYEMAIDLLGYTHASLLDDVVDSLSAGDASTVFGAVDRVIQTGHDPRRFVEDLLERFRDLIIVGAMEESARHVLRAVPEDAIARMQNQARQLGRAELSRAADITNAALTEMTGATSPRLHLELLCARLLLPGADAGERGVAARVDRIERRLNYAAPDAGRGPASAISGAVEHGVEHVGLTPAAGAPTAAATDGALTDASRGDGARADRSDRPQADDAGDRPARGPSPVAARPIPATDGAARPTPARPAPARPAPASTDESAAVSAPEPARPAPSRPSLANPPTPDVAGDGAAEAPARVDEETAGDAAVTENVSDAVDGTDRTAPGDPTEDRDVPTDHDESPVAAAPVDPEDLPEPPPSRQPGGNAAAEDDEPGDAVAPSSDAEPTPTPAPSDGGSSDVDMVRRAWPEVLEALGRTRKVAWILVSQNGTVRALRENTLYLEFPTPGIAEQFGRHEEHLREALGSVLGLQARIVAVHPGSAPPSEASRAGADSAAGGSRPKAPAESAGRPTRPADPGRAGSGGAAPASPSTARDGGSATAAAPPDRAQSDRAQSGAAQSGASHDDGSQSGRAQSGAAQFDRAQSGAAQSDRVQSGNAASDGTPAGTAGANPRERVWSPSGPTPAPAPGAPRDASSSAQPTPRSSESAPAQSGAPEAAPSTSSPSRPADATSISTSTLTSTGSTSEQPSSPQHDSTQTGPTPSDSTQPDSKPSPATGPSTAATSSSDSGPSSSGTGTGRADAPDEPADRSRGKASTESAAEREATDRADGSNRESAGRPTAQSPATAVSAFPWDDEPPLPDEPDLDEPPFPDDEYVGAGRHAPGRQASMPAGDQQPARPRAARPAQSSLAAGSPAGEAPARPAPGASRGADAPARPAPGAAGTPARPAPAGLRDGDAPARPAPGASRGTDAPARPAPGSTNQADAPARPAPGASADAPARPAPGIVTETEGRPAPGTNGRRPAAVDAAPASDGTEPPAAEPSAAAPSPTPAAPATVPTPMEDIPSEDDLVLEDSGRAGRAAAERVLGAQLIDERELLRD
ncbi:DNA polymerase III subunit gamma and tau [Tersicoccus sp. MR15.9]|uniref:DNA polymerase III subunit gamma and tau n=1 Tax=Tersicoccus mangrovi TaxID=3121635 RepID=UPI002FE55894